MIFSKIINYIYILSNKKYYSKYTNILFKKSFHLKNIIFFLFFFKKIKLY